MYQYSLSWFINLYLRVSKTYNYFLCKLINQVLSDNLMSTMTIKRLFRWNCRGITKLQEKGIKVIKLLCSLKTAI